MNETLYHVFQFKSEGKKFNKEIAKYNLYILAHIGFGFDSYAVLSNPPHWRTVVSLIKNGLSIVSFERFNGYEDENKIDPQYVHFRCGRIHIKSSLKQTVISYKLQSSLFKQQMDHDEIYEDTWEDKKMSCYFILRTTCYQQLSVMLDIVKVWKN